MRARACRVLVSTNTITEFSRNGGRAGTAGTVAVAVLCDTPLVTVCRVAAAEPDDETPLVEDVLELTVPVCVPGADAVPVLPVVTATRLVRESVAVPVVTAADDVTDDAAAAVAAAAVADVAMSLVGTIACDVTG